MYKKYTNFLSLNFTRKQQFPADPLSEPHGPPGVRGPQFGKHCSGYSAIGLTFITAALAAYPLFYNISCRPIDKKPIYKPAMQNFKSFWGSRTPLKLEEIGREG